MKKSKMTKKKKDKIAKQKDRIDRHAEGMVTGFATLYKMFRDQKSYAELCASVDLIKSRAKEQQDFHVLVTKCGASKAQTRSLFDGKYVMYVVYAMCEG